MDEQKVLLDQFGRLVVQYVRDEMIAAVDQAFAGERRDIYSKYLYSLMQDLSPECLSFARKLVPHVVDSTIAVFLQLLSEEDVLRLEMRDAHNIYVDLSTLTDSLEAEYSFSKGWALSFSRERPDTISVEAARLFDHNSDL
jgi:hypothetical protein